jgi:transposase-like protein
MAVTESLVTPAPMPLSRTGTQSSSVERKANRSPRRILSEDQKREVARLYAETTTSVPAIKRQFGIAESSLYRLIQQRGVAPRGRIPAASRSVSKATRQQTGLNGEMARSRQSVRSRSRGSARQTSSASPSSESSFTYRVSFAALRIVTAVDIRDAIRQAEALGATEITAIIRSE